MGIRGQKPKAAALRVYPKRRGHGALLSQAEPSDCVAKVPPAPESLGADAAVHWPFVCGELIAMGLMQRADMVLIETFCMAWARCRRANKELEEQPLTSNNDNGGEYPNPLIQIAIKAEEQIRKIANDIGFNPTSRTRLIDAKPQAKSMVARRERG